MSDPQRLLGAADRPPLEIVRQLGRYGDHVQTLAHMVAETGKTLVWSDTLHREVAVLMPASTYRRLRQIEAAMADEMSAD